MPLLPRDGGWVCPKIHFGENTCCSFVFVQVSVCLFFYELVLYLFRYRMSDFEGGSLKYIFGISLVAVGLLVLSSEMGVCVTVGQSQNLNIY